MMQELLNVVQHNYNSNPNSSSSSVNTSNSLSSPSSTSDHPPQQNLRCPRCDSSNTKFCYYNNYNLTQPRHFCKTCRRYWTKGGALRNVPIGGGCRKSRTIVTSTGPTTNKTGPQKPKPTVSASDIMGLQSPGPNLQLPPGLAPYSSHLLALLKASSQMQQNPNSHNLLNSYRIKEEMINANNQQQQMQHSLWNNNMDLNNANYYFPSFGSASTTAMSMSTAGLMEAVPLLNGDNGFWGSGAGLAWNDVSTSNGAFP